MSSLRPNSANNRLQRIELLDLLNHSRDFNLTLILAPAGCGKSTLLQQWQQQNSHMAIAFLSLTRRHQDPIVFLRHLHNSLIQQGLSLASINALNADLEQADTLAQALLECFAHISTDFYIIIDDFHYASAPITQALFASFLADLPSHIHIILATRSYPHFSLSRLKLDDKLLLIDSHDLRLPLTQLNELCALLQQPQLSQSEVDDLNRLTEGWFAGIKLALLARAKTGILNLNHLKGSQSEIIDYFVNVVLHELNSDLRDFLLASAIFDSFDALLMQYILPHQDNKALLQQVIHNGLFINATNEMQLRYRYHPLFQHSLRIHLHHHLSPSYIQHLHQRAADYFLTHHDRESALHHVQQLNDEQQFLAMLEVCCKAWFKEGKLPLMLQWLDKLSLEQRLTQPHLALLQLAACIFSRQFSQAKYLLALIKPNLRLSSSSEVIDILLLSERILNLFENDTYEHLSELSSTHTLALYDDIRSAELIFMARHYMLKGQFEQAIRYAKQGNVLLEQLGHDYLSASFASVIIILSERELGHILIARQMTLSLFHKYIDHENTPCWTHTGTCMAVSLYEQNVKADAKALCEKLMTAIDSACATELVVYVYITLSRLQTNTNKANQLLLQLRRILRHGNYHRFLNQLLVEELSHALRHDKIAQIKHIAEEYEILNNPQISTWQHAPTYYQESWVYGGIAAALYLRSKKQYDKALAILDLLSHYLSTSQMRMRFVVVCANKIVILSLQGQFYEAKKQLQTLFNTVGLQCAIKTVFDEAPDFASLLKETHDEGLITLPAFYLQLYHDVLYPLPQTIEVSSPPKAATEALTSKEAEVLALMQKGLSNQQISDILHISLSTTKWHIKNIFSKLNVSNRAAAVALSLHKAR